MTRCLAAGLEKPSGESQRLEDLERAGMHHRRAVPMERPRQGIDQMAWYTAPMKLRSEQQPRRPGADHSTTGRQPVETALPSSVSLPELLMERVTAPLRITNDTYCSARSFVSVRL